MLLRPLFSFGAISDVQYANCDNGSNHQKTRMRYYRNSLIQLQRAADRWKADAHGVSFVLQLGDLVDGRNQCLGTSEQALKKTLCLFDDLRPGTWTHHCIGNHELYNMSHLLAARSLWPTLAGSGNVNPALFDSACSDDTTYYSFSPHPGFRFIKVDHYEVAYRGYAKDSPQYARAAEYLSINANAVKEEGRGLKGLDRRFVAYNGAMSERQLAWLEDKLMAAEHDGEKVFIFGHQSILAGSANPSCLLWNYEAVNDVLERFECVVMHLSGHEHRYWRACDSRGVHHLSMPAVIETEPRSEAYGIFRVFNTGIQLEGFGDLPSGWYDFDRTIAGKTQKSK